MINSKFYKEEVFSNITSRDTRSIFPGDLRVARCLFFGGFKSFNNSNFFKPGSVSNNISFRTDFMSPGDRNGLPDVLLFGGSL